MTIPTTSPAKTRLRLRFSLRALLVFITLVACGPGWIGLHLARRYREDAAIDHLKQAGSISTYWASLYDQPSITALNPEMPDWPRPKTGVVNWLRNLDLFRTVVMFSC